MTNNHNINTSQKLYSQNYLLFLSKVILVLQSKHKVRPWAKDAGECKESAMSFLREGVHHIDSWEK